MTTDITAADLTPVLRDAGTGIRVVRDTATGAVAIVLDATAANALDIYLDGLGALHDVAGDDADDDTLAGADAILTIKALLRA